MIDERYYRGYEGEVEVIVYSENKKGLKIWEGYFENLLSGCFNERMREDGLLLCYTQRDGFYDEKPWKIPNIESVISEVIQFDENQVETESSQMILSLKQLREDLLILFEEAKNKKSDVYIDYD